MFGTRSKNMKTCLGLEVTRGFGFHYRHHKQLVIVDHLTFTFPPLPPLIDLSFFVGDLELSVLDVISQSLLLKWFGEHKTMFIIFSVSHVLYASVSCPLETSFI